jgi:hypothetical protein
MALQINTEIQTRDGFAVPNAYGRVSVTDNFDGEKVHGIVEFFVNEQAFLNGAQAFKTNLMQWVAVPYNRATDGTDVLNIGHDALVTSLAGQGISATKVL